MRHVERACGTAGRNSPQDSPLVWLAIMIAVTALLSLAVIAAVSLGIGALLPGNEPFIPGYTT